MRPTAALVLMSVLFTSLPAQAGFRVSSYRQDSKAGNNFYNVGSCLDGKPETAWMVDPENENVGQWIEIDVPRSTIDSLKFQSGWAKDADTFADYARIKKAKVQVFKEDDGDEVLLEKEITLEDKIEWQTLDLDDTKVGGDFSGGRVRIEVTEVYEGKDYPALAVSEVLVALTESEAPIKLKSEPTTAAGSNVGGNLVDGKTSTYWLSESNEGQEFTVGANDFGIAKLGIAAGPSKYARPKKLSIRQGISQFELELQNTDKMQWLDVPATIGFTGSRWGDLVIEISEVYEGSEPGIAIGEVQLKSTNFDG